MNLLTFQDKDTVSKTRKRKGRKEGERGDGEKENFTSMFIKDIALYFFWLDLCGLGIKVIMNS